MKTWCYKMINELGFDIDIVCTLHWILITIVSLFPPKYWTNFAMQFLEGVLIITLHLCASILLDVLQYYLRPPAQPTQYGGIRLVCCVKLAIIPLLIYSTSTFPFIRCFLRFLLASDSCNFDDCYFLWFNQTQNASFAVFWWIAFAVFFLDLLQKLLKKKEKKQEDVKDKNGEGSRGTDTKAALNKDDVNSTSTVCEIGQISIWEHEAECNRMKELITKQEAELSKLEKEFAKQEAECNKLKEEFAKQETECSNLKEELAKKEIECCIMKEEVVEQGAEGDELKEELAKKEAEVVKFLEEEFVNSCIQETKNACIQEVDKLKEELLEEFVNSCIQEAEVDKLKEELQEEFVNSCIQETELNKLKKEFAKQEAEYIELLEEFVIHEAGGEKLKEEFLKQEAELSELLDEFVRQDAEVDKLKEEFVKQEAECTKLKEENKKLCLEAAPAKLQHEAYFKFVSQILDGRLHEKCMEERSQLLSERNAAIASIETYRNLLHDIGY